MEGWWWVSLRVCVWCVCVCACTGGWVSEWVGGWVSEWAPHKRALSHAWHAKEAEPKGRQGVYPTPYIRPLGKAHCPTPATQKRRRPKGRQGVHPTPWQCTLSHACHAKEAETQGTPGRASDPLAMHIVPRLPRKRGGDPRDARACIRPLGNAHCPTPATQKRRRPKGRQGVHPTPWQCTLSQVCHAKEAETQGTPGRASDPLAMHIVPRLPRKRGGDPRDARAYIRPWQCTLSHACHAKEAETQGTPGRTSDPLAMHIVPSLPRKRGGDPRDARAYIRPLGNAHCPTPATQKRRRPKGRQGVRPKGRQGVHPTPWQCTLSHACHAKEAETQGTPRRASDPLAMHIVPRLPRKRGGDPRDARACIRPLGNAHCHTPATQKRRRPKGRQGVHLTPWQCTLSQVCHAKEAETQGTPGHTSDPLAMHIVPRLPRKRGGVHPTPWQCTLSHACHAKAMETNPRACIRPLGSVRVSVRVSVCVCEGVSEWVSEMRWDEMRWLSEWVRWVSEWWGRRAGGRSGYRTKNKNPTRQCGELRLFPKHSLHTVNYDQTVDFWLPIVRHPSIAWAILGRWSYRTCFKSACKGFDQRL